VFTLDAPIKPATLALPDRGFRLVALNEFNHFAQGTPLR